MGVLRASCPTASACREVTAIQRGLFGVVLGIGENNIDRVGETDPVVGVLRNTWPPSTEDSSGSLLLPVAQRSRLSVGRPRLHSKLGNEDGWRSQR